MPYKIEISDEIYEELSGLTANISAVVEYIVARDIKNGLKKPHLGKTDKRTSLLSRAYYYQVKKGSLKKGTKNKFLKKWSKNKTFKKLYDEYESSEFNRKYTPTFIVNPDTKKLEVVPSIEKWKYSKH